MKKKPGRARASLVTSKRSQMPNMGYQKRQVHLVRPLGPRPAHSNRTRLFLTVNALAGHNTGVLANLWPRNFTRTFGQKTMEAIMTSANEPLLGTHILRMGTQLGLVRKRTINWYPSFNNNVRIYNNGIIVDCHHSNLKWHAPKLMCLFRCCAPLRSKYWKVEI